MRTFLIYSLLMATVFAQPTRKEVLGNVREYLGGMEAWSKIHSIQSAGKVIIGDNVEMEIDIYRKRPGMMRSQVDLKNNGQTLEVGVKGEQAWIRSRYENAEGETIFQPVPVDDVANWRMLSEAQFGWPVHLILEPSTLCELSTNEPPEEGLVGLQLRRENWFGTLWVEPATGEPKYVSYQHAPDGTVQTVLLGDWRIHNGVRFPYRFFIHVDQTQENRFILDSMQINKGILSSYFVPPKETGEE